MAWFSGHSIGASDYGPTRYDGSSNSGAKRHHKSLFDVSRGASNYFSAGGAIGVVVNIDGNVN
jgi:hypothetical protein